MKSKKVLSWIAFLFWMFLIFFLSSQGGDDSAELSGGTDRLHGRAEGKDDHFPEEWIMSVTAANNADRAAGADGLIIEVHNDPAHARCDGPQSITPDAFERLARRLGKIRAALAD